MKKRIAIPLILMMMFSVLAGCAGQANNSTGATDGNQQGSSDGKPKVTVVLMELSAQYFKFMEAGAKAAFQEFGVDGKVIAPSNQSQVIEQVNMIETTLNEKPDALVLMPSQPESALPVLKKYKEKGIPVLLIDTDVPNWEDKTSYIGTNNDEAGYTAAQLVAKQLNKGDKVAILEGIAGTYASETRIAGAKRGLTEAGLEIAVSQSADWDRVKATSVMENILQAHPDVKAVVAANDEMALGAVRATEAKGLKIPVVGVDGIIEAVESVNKGVLFGSVAQKPYDMGYLGVKNALAAIKGEPVEKRIDSGLDTITKENAESKLKDLKAKLGQ
ncbi:sugar ABC transporter substrate-binding protein [Brevibacillus agri]|uniref:sugar ABC transporter substrate-binding protein n=1 Tax=Brevibacillus TaxID=55080 RepID=UPI000402603D|nr:MULTISPECIES: sugar ABC transporter substrate-binding protein [Brevibacillus]MBY0052171.1 sugar ABC transporter substrate-binding protein [Brevibacillus agri]MCG5252217.1 sugar ABC transporter substrate-binding protein [Brevibacillus agri]MDN4093941.1 sugar ABC transporter substrate-binding protein [Brevibacillus agri]MED1645400.1 sugar ABC transporter substrate-binding protein [Brevibacillus agri]MED1655209.1 sugar ABC transporter substrate-binding protein [Brevibacillus agri]